jgi:vacuolar iron transporter family protein
MTSDHFQGKSVVDHLRDARMKGAFASAEVHGVEMPGHLAAAADAARESAIALLLIWILLRRLPVEESKLLSLLLIFSGGWLLWKVARSSLLGWSRLERLHRLIEEEKWEIEHHREQEREELTALYRAKGLSGKLLDEVIDILMADDNRLLRVMLEEELGLTLEAYEHPLKQSLGAALGVVLSTTLAVIAFWLNPAYGIFVATGITLTIATSIAMKLEKNRVIPAIIWTLATAFLVGGVTYFITQSF